MFHYVEARPRLSIGWRFQTRTRSCVFKTQTSTCKLYWVRILEQCRCGEWRSSLSKTSPLRYVKELAQNDRSHNLTFDPLAVNVLQEPIGSFRTNLEFDERAPVLLLRVGAGEKRGARHFQYEAVRALLRPVSAQQRDVGGGGVSE